jgi:hypothetical protein
MLRPVLFVNPKKKQKLKKNALEPVNFEEEKKNDPKYKTELCKTFLETNFCPYGNKCRFAHGNKELNNKEQIANYKKKLCKSFHSLGYCMYGNRCNFKHFEIKTDTTSHYYEKLFYLEKYTPVNKRLSIFIEITNDYKVNSINDDISKYDHNDTNSKNNINNSCYFLTKGNLLNQIMFKEGRKLYHC